MLYQIHALNRGAQQAAFLYLRIKLSRMVMQPWGWLLVVALGMALAARFLFAAAIYAAGLARPW